MPVSLRRGVLVAAGLACLVLLALLVRGGERSHAASSKPNIIMFTTDDQTVRDLAAMPKTQALLGAQGANFLHAYVSMSLCCPSRITVQTGQYAHNHHVMGNTPPQGGYSVFNDKNDLPVWLQQAGYRTIHIGKMPNGFGIETNETYVPPGWGPFNGGAGRGEFYAFIKPASDYTDFALDQNGVLKQYTPDDYQTTVYGDLAVDRIDQHFTSHANDPLYMQVQFFAPHDPATPETKYQNSFATAPLPIDPSFNEKNVKDKPGWIRKISRFGPGLIAKIQTRYQHRLETLLSVDDQVERIVNELSAEGQLANTYIIFTSDNGFMQGQHRLHQGKFAPYEPSIQVPLLIRGPGIPGGSQPRALVWNGDITSTILKIADAQPGLPQDGRSLLPYARDPNLNTYRPILIETGPPGATNEPGTPVSAASARVHFSKYVKNLDQDHTAQIARAIVAPRYRAIRTGRYLLVKYSDGSRELYDLKRDPLELKSKYKDSRYFPVRKYLLKKLKGLVLCQGADCSQDVKKPPKPLAKKKKRSKKKSPPASPAPVG
ncbi:MAG TPA: sulfatase [Solirubrobacterales bacterium]|nr:sulfatase [Solirubrobacterales bacterium]